MATVHCSKCTAERKGFRRELDSWRHKLIHCIGFESILEGIYGPLLLRDLNLFEDCEPEEVIDWSPEESGSQCSLCHLSLDKHNDQVLSATSPLSSPSDYSPRHVPFLSESSQSAHKFLQAVFHKKDMPHDYDPNIPLIAQELMKKMIHQFAMEYASKCLLHTTSNSVPKKNSTLSETADTPLDLTVSRAQELKEPQADGVLDLSNRKSAISPTSKPSVSSVGHKGSGCCLSTIVQEPGEPKRQGTKNSALGAVLGLLCPAHQSLIYRVLKLAHQQKLLFFKTLKQVKHECYCCHCGKHFDNHISHFDGAMSDCTPCGCCQHWLNDHCRSRCSEDSKYSCSTHPFVLKVCGHETARDSDRCSMQLCISETCTNICHKKIHCHSCESHSPNNIDGALCTYRPTVLPSSSTLTLCPLSVCSSQHNMHSSLTEAKSAKCTEDGSIISVIKNECSPPPSLPSHIPANLNNKGNERSQGHDHVQDQGAEPVRDKSPSNVNLNGSVKRQKCKNTKSCQTKKVSRLFLQDINLLSEKREAIKPSERGLSVTAASVAEESQLQSASKNVEMNTDAHMTEIITTVLHTGSASGYCLTELIDHQKNKEAQAPNTRSRRRHELLSAKVTLGGDATNHKGTQIKQEVKRLDQLYSEKKTIKRENQSLSDSCEVTNCKTVKKLNKDNGTLVNSNNKNAQGPLKLSNHFGKSRKSKRTIVPPPRFSSYVTEPRKMYFVACFSDSIFNQKSQTDEILSVPQRLEALDGSSASHNGIEHSQKTQNEATLTSIKEQSPIHNNVDTQAEELSADATTTPPCSLSQDDTCVKYTSPIKLMFISPLKDEEGMKYSLKSAASVNGLQADEYFDPCEESSWSGTPEKNTSQGTLTTSKASPLKSSSSPSKRACVLARSSPSKTSPNKSPSPVKSDSTPKSSSSSKIGLRRSVESSPNKCVAVDDTPRSLHDALALHETTPPKRRPGRPKKLGPQLEKKVKRPIGRPRKEKVIQSTVNEKSANGNTVAPDIEENVNKNLKITVLYGRSRRNKRMVSEGFDQLQTEFHDACQAVGLNNKWSMLMNTAKMNSTDLNTAKDGLSPEIPLMKPVKVCAKSNIKCQSLDDGAPSRKPGRPAKVKISGISVTVTTVSPRQRRIQMNKEKTSPIRRNCKKALFQESRSAKEPKTITCHSLNKNCVLETEEPKVESNIEPNPPVAIRHSERVRKPSIHFLHAVATSSSYSRGSALVRCSKQLQVNEASCELKNGKSQSKPLTSGESEIKQKVGKTRCLGLQQMSSVSVESVYSPKEVKWWSASVQEKTLNQELARRIRFISDSWVSPTAGTEDGTSSSKNSASSKKSKHSSVVRSLFDCSPNKPRSCSMQQICSWFMQTTETQSLTIVKKASSRNSYELMHFPRSTNKKSVCYSPQAERLRKHLKKFAKSFPQSPYDFKQSQKKINKTHSRSNISPSARRKEMSKRRHKSSNTYQVTLHRAKRRFFTRKERNHWMNSKTQCTLNKRGTSGTGSRLQPLPKLTSKPLPSCGLPLVSAHVAKDYLCFKTASPETLKDCRVFLRKIHSLNNGPAVEENTNTLDDRSPSLLQWTTEDKAVKTDQVKSSKRTCLKDSESRSHKSVQAQHVQPMRRRSHSVGLVSESTPPAKRLRQSRMRGLSGPRWRDFVFGN